VILNDTAWAGHYAHADIGRLTKHTNLLFHWVGTQTVLRVANG